jgi:hypothetical protein
MSILTIFIISLFLYDLVRSGTSYSNIREMKSSLGAGQDLVRVNLGISEEYPNTRIVYYSDVNNDK